MFDDKEKVIARLGAFEDNLVTSENGEWQPQLYVSDDGCIQAISACRNSGLPGAVWHGLDTYFNLPNVRTDLLKIWVEENLGLFQALLDSHETHWNGSNYKGRFDDDAEHNIEVAIEAATQDMCYDYVCWEASDILENTPETYVTTSTTDEEIAKIATEQIEYWADPSIYIGPDVQDRISESLSNARQERRDS